MGFATPEELVLFRLTVGERDEGGAGATFAELVEGTEALANGLSDQIALAAALEDLREDGVVESVGDGSAADPRFRLTEAGRDRAAETHDRILRTEVRVLDTDERSLTVERAAEEFDRSPVEVYASLSNDRVYAPLNETPSEGLVGRDAERDRCESVVTAATASRSGRGLFLAGPMGVGKTALLEAVRDDARAAGLDVLGARCRGPDDPYQPLRDCLETVWTDHPIAESVPEAEDPEGYQVQKSALFHDLTDALAPDPGSPVRLVWFDDLHLADRETTAYLAWLLDRLPEVPVVLVGTYRRATLSAQLADAIEDQTDSDWVTHVDLGPLPESVTRSLVERTVGQQGAPGAFVEAVHEWTGGNPLFVEETVERLLELDELDPGYEWYPEDPGAVGVPDAVAEVVTERVDALGDPASGVLRWAAIVGQEVPLDVLADVCGEPADRLERLVDALVEGGVFETTADGDTAVFSSAAVRHSLVTDLDSDERCRRHAAVARALEARYGPEGVAETGGGAAAIANHYERADDAERAIAWYLRAGERARDVYAYETAVDTLRSALALARSAGDDESVTAVARELSEITLTTGEYDDAERYVGFVRERASDPAVRQWAAAAACEIANARGEYESALETARTALEATATPSRERVRLLGEKATAERFTSEYDQARETTNRQLETAAAIEAPGLEARANLNMGELRWRRDDYDAARESLRAALETAREAGDRQTVGEAHLHLGVVAWNRGEYDRARDAYRAAREEFEAVGDRHRIAMVHNNIGDVAHDQGQYDDAAAAYQRALEGFEMADNRRAIGIAYLNLGKTATRRGEYDTAESSLTDALSELESVGATHVASVTRLHLGTVAIRRAEYDRAREYLDEARSTFESLEDRHRVASTDHRRGVLALATGDYEDAESALTDALSGFRTVDASQDVAGAKLDLGRLAIETGDCERAREFLSDAMDTFEAAGNHHERARVRLQLGRLARAEGDPDLAQRRLETALEALEGLGASHDSALARRALGHLAAQRGDTERARDNLEVAVAAFERIGAAGDALETLGRLADVSSDGDDPTATASSGRVERVREAASERALAEHGHWLES